MSKPITVKIEDIPDFLEETNLEIEPGSARWEQDPDHPDRLRFSVNVQKRTEPKQTDK